MIPTEGANCLHTFYFTATDRDPACTRCGARVSELALRAAPAGNEGELDRPDEIAASAVKYCCDQCIEEENEFSCHSREDVVIVGRRVLCTEHAKEFPHLPHRKVPDV